MTDTDKAVLDNLEREALALLERATFSIRGEDHARAVRSDEPHRRDRFGGVAEPSRGG